MVRRGASAHVAKRSNTSLHVGLQRGYGIPMAGHMNGRRGLLTICRNTGRRPVGRLWVSRREAWAFPTFPSCWTHVYWHSASQMGPSTS